jgi:hypothetical protein
VTASQSLNISHFVATCKLWQAHNVPHLFQCSQYKMKNPLSSKIDWTSSVGMWTDQNSSVATSPPPPPPKLPYTLHVQPWPGAADSGQGEAGEGSSPPVCCQFTPSSRDSLPCFVWYITSYYVGRSSRTGTFNFTGTKSDTSVAVLHAVVSGKCVLLLIGGAHVAGQSRDR